MHAFTCLAVVIALFGSVAFAADEQPPAGKGTLYHVVSLKFQASATKEQIATADATFAALKDKIPGITSLVWGDNVSPENRNKGFTQCFVATFATAKDRDAYLVHPEHKALGSVLGPVLDEVMVIDFWAK